jgi:hypothetical protein
LYDFRLASLFPVATDKSKPKWTACHRAAVAAVSVKKCGRHSRQNLVDGRLLLLLPEEEKWAAKPDPSPDGVHGQPVASGAFHSEVDAVLDLKKN